MPRQSDSAENKPGEKAMMRKLAVMVLALSFATLGCGSDDGKKPTTDGGIDGPKTTDVKPADVAPDVNPADVAGDLPPAVDLGPDKATVVEVGVDQGVDQGTGVDVGKDAGVDGTTHVDVGGPDLKVGVDSTPGVDLGASEAGTAG
jgi:hypothetical protein